MITLGESLLINSSSFTSNSAVERGNALFLVGDNNRETRNNHLDNQLNDPENNPDNRDDHPNNDGIDYEIENNYYKKEIIKETNPYIYYISDNPNNLNNSKNYIIESEGSEKGDSWTRRHRILKNSFPTTFSMPDIDVRDRKYIQEENAEGSEKVETESEIIHICGALKDWYVNVNHPSAHYLNNILFPAKNSRYFLMTSLKNIL